MATNPMQRKARNSFLLGMLLMLVITGVVIAFLAIMLMNRIKADNENKANMTNVYVLTQDVRSGDLITNDMIDTISVDRRLVPSNATSDVSLFINYAMQDKDGNEIITKTVTEINESGKQENKNKNYIVIDGTEYEVKEDEAHPENRYIVRNGENQYLDLVSVPLMAAVDMKKNTVLTTDFIEKGDNTTRDDVRTQEYNVVILPTDLATGDYIDIRLMLPNGQDFIVVSRKEVKIPEINGIPSEDTIWIDLAEDETLHMSAAIMDVAKINGAKLYATKYTNPGLQNAAEPTYIAGDETIRLLRSDPNIVTSAMEEISERYSRMNNENIKIRDTIQGAVNTQGDQAQTNLETNMEESITKSKETRKDYLDSLAGATATTTTSGTATTNTTD